MKPYKVYFPNSGIFGRSIVLLTMTLLTSGVTAVSQSLSKEITVNREVVLTHREANRLTTLPRVELPALSKPSLGYSFSTSSADITDDISLLPPVTFGDTLTPSPYRGYLMPGYFPVQRLNVSAGYRLIDNNRTRLGVMLQYDRNQYSTGRTTPNQERNGVFKDNTVSAALGLHQVTGRDSWLDASVNYTYARHRVPEGLSTHYGVNRTGVSVDFYNKSGEWRYNIGGSMKYFGTSEVPEIINTHHREIYGTIGGSLEYGSLVSDNILKGIDYSITVGNSRISPKLLYLTGGSADPSYKSNKTDGLLKLTPFLRFGRDAFSGRVGVDVEFCFNRGPVFRIAPDINLTWYVAKYFTLALEARGGVTRNTASSLYDRSYMVSLPTIMDNAYVPIDAQLTFKAGSWRGLWASVSAGFSVAKDWAMPVDCGSVVASEWSAFDISGWRASVAAGYSWRGLAGINASLEVAPQKYNRGYYLWRDRAGYVARIGLDFHPLRQLTLDAGWELRGKRHTTFYRTIGEFNLPYLVSLRNVSDINVKASWQFTPAFSVWAEGANLLNRKWEMLAPFTAQGRNAMVGVSWLF